MTFLGLLTSENNAHGKLEMLDFAISSVIMNLFCFALFRTKGLMRECGNGPFVALKAGSN